VNLYRNHSSVVNIFSSDSDEGAHRQLRRSSPESDKKQRGPTMHNSKTASKEQSMELQKTAPSGSFAFSS